MVVLQSTVAIACANVIERGRLSVPHLWASRNRSKNLSSAAYLILTERDIKDIHLK